MSKVIHDLESGICPTCQRETRVKVIAEHATSWSDEQYPIHGSDRYWVLQCQGCDTVYFGHGSTFSEEVDHRYNQRTHNWESFSPERRTFYPRTLKRPKPNWLNEPVVYNLPQFERVLQEVYSALDNELPTLAAIGMRTVVDILAIHLGATNLDSFEKKIEHLRSRHHVTGRERDFLTVLVDAGSSAAHRGWKPKSDELSTMIEIIEGIIHRTIILPSKVEKLRASVPPKIAGD